MADGNPTRRTGFHGIGEVIPVPKRLLTPVQERFLNMPTMPDDDTGILFAHSVFCQTSMPYRDPGTDVRTWTKTNGFVSLRIVAGSGYTGNGQWVEIGLPWGPKPRLVLYHLNVEALRKQSPLVELEANLTSFVSRTLGLDSHGRNINVVKKQLSCLAAAEFYFGMSHEGRPQTVKDSIVKGFELWTPKSEKQRVLWPTTVRFSDGYFSSLMEHAVPLNENAVATLAHSSLALDVYTWLAQRLHRVPIGKDQFVPIIALKQQFGEEYGRMPDFRVGFKRALDSVKKVYPDAKFSVATAGMILSHSKPPYPKRAYLVASE